MSQSHHIPHHALVINDAEKLDHTISLATRMMCVQGFILGWGHSPSSHSVCARVFECLCVCVCGCPGGLLVKSWAHNSEDTGLIPGRREISVPTSPPICKTGTWSCTGEQSALAVPHGPLMVVVGLQCAHTCSGITRCT